MKSPPAPPLTLGSAAAGYIRVVIWCKECDYLAEPDPAETVDVYGAETSVLDWHHRLVCPKCGSRQIHMVLTGA